MPYISASIYLFGTLLIITVSLGADLSEYEALRKESSNAATEVADELDRQQEAAIAGEMSRQLNQPIPDMPCPRPIVRIEPMYPADQAEQQVSGWVLVRFRISKDGGVDDVEAIDSHPHDVFESAVMSAVRKWRYKPAIRGEKPVDYYPRFFRYFFLPDRMSAPESWRKLRDFNEGECPGT
jgi:TonB family protein